MKRFAFRLEAVLKYRRTVEDLRETAFRRAQDQCDSERLRLASLKSHYDQTVSGRPGAGEHVRFDASDIQARERYLETLQVQIAKQAERAEVAGLIAEEKRAEMVAARQASESVGRIREKDFAAYQAEAQRKTQDGLDEVASMQFERKLVAERVRVEDASRRRLAAEAASGVDAESSHASYRSVER